MNAHDSSQSGVSLVTVLMIVAAMSAVAVGITQTLSRGISRAKTMDAQAQFRVSYPAAESYAMLQLGQLLSESEGKLSTDLRGFSTPIIFQSDYGLATISFRDQSNCFDLNTLVEAEAEGEGVVEIDEDNGVNFLVDALVGAGIEQYGADIFADSVADWIDDDNYPRLSGAEDGFYSGGASKVQTPDDWLKNISELNGIRGYNEDIKPLVPELLCVRPKSDDNAVVPLNINTVNEAQIPLLVVAYDGELDESVFESVLRRRPTNGWTSLEAFIAEAELGQLETNLQNTLQVSLYSSFIEAEIKLQYQGIIAAYEVLYHLQPGEKIEIVHRRRTG